MILVRLFLLIILLAFLLAMNLVQLISLALLPFHKVQFQRFNSACGALWWSCLVFNLEHVCKLQVEIIENFKETSQSTAKPLHSEANILFLSNHQSLIDPLVILILAKRLGGLSYLKWFVKESLIYVPFLGWGLWLLDSIFLKRNWNQDEKSIALQFKKIKNSKDPVWLVYYPEGTRKSHTNVLASRNFAMKSNQEPYRNVLFPRYKGFIANIQGMERRLDSIYDLTISYSNRTSSVMNLLRGDLGKVKVFIEFFPRQNLPQTSLLLKEWLFLQFRKKDAILEQQAHAQI